MVILTCQQCGAEFERRLSQNQIASGSGKFCSRDCYTASDLKKQLCKSIPSRPKNPPSFNCKACGELFTSYGKSAAFCSNSCKSKFSNRKHGKWENRTHKIWAGMIDRATNPSSPAYYKYGGAGRSVCDRWLNFDAFLSDMGEAPAGLSIDRINNTLGYAPDNCRWATRLEQSRNRGNYNHKINGKTISELAKEQGLTYKGMWGRLKRQGLLTRPLLHSLQQGPSSDA